MVMVDGETVVLVYEQIVMDDHCGGGRWRNQGGGGRRNRGSGHA